MIVSSSVFQVFFGLDPLLQAVAVIALIAFMAIAAYPTWRYFRKLRNRRRSSQVWIHY